MLCKRPFTRGLRAHGCGQCTPCRVKLRRTWAHRICLESFLHKDCSFVTLTYDEESLPDRASLRKEDYQDWLKRLRDKIYPAKVRYFVVGEYGDDKERPHFHAALFGLRGCVTYPFVQQKVQRRKCRCYDCSLIRETWGFGLTDNAHLSWDSAHYMSGYVTKKMTRDTNKVQQEYLKGRHPEFARMSLKPGIGAGFMSNVAESLMTDAGVLSIEENHDVPTILRHGKKELPLGRYLRKKLRERIGLNEDLISEENAEKFRLQMLEVQERAFTDKRNPTASFKEQIKIESQQKILEMETRLKIYKKGGSL